MEMNQKRELLQMLVSGRKDERSAALELLETERAGIRWKLGAIDNDFDELEERTGKRYMLKRDATGRLWYRNPELLFRWQSVPYPGYDYEGGEIYVQPVAQADKTEE